MITIKKGQNILDYKTFLFPGGEVGLKLNAANYKYTWDKSPVQTIIARIQNSADFMELAMAKDALSRIDDTPINLVLPYLPYARQDRVCDKGEAFSLKVFANLLNSLKFNKVTIFDPHSDVTQAVIDNAKIITQFDLINKNLPLTNRIKNCILVSPDAGANKKTMETAKYLEHSNFVRADKLRDLSTGKIKETIVYCDDFKGQDVCVCDDIGDGMTTFIELAKVCKKRNCGKFVVYITHGIFSKGTRICFENGIDEIWTTDSYRWFSDNMSPRYDEKINILNLENRFPELF